MVLHGFLDQSSNSNLFFTRRRPLESLVKLSNVFHPLNVSIISTATITVFPLSLPISWTVDCIVFYSFFRVSCCATDPNFTQVLAFISRAHEGHDLTCYALLCSNFSMVIHRYTDFLAIIISSFLMAYLKSSSSCVLS